MAVDIMSGPIPGANYTSDTKNYPWHRPPEITDLDKAIEAISGQFKDVKAITGLLTMVEMGTDISTLTSILLMTGIGAGKWTPDFALLLAGPTAHYITLLCEGYGVDYDLGIDEKNDAPTKAYFEAVKIDKERAMMAAKGINMEEIEERAAEQTPPSRGAYRDWETDRKSVV